MFSGTGLAEEAISIKSQAFRSRRHYVETEFIEVLCHASIPIL
jgi:hypothetical protein